MKPLQNRAVLGLSISAFAVVAAMGAAEEDFKSLSKRLEAEKPTFAKRHQELLEERYDLADRPAPGVTMSRGKPVQDGVRVEAARGHDLGEARRDVAGGDQEAESLAGGFLPAAASAPRSGRHGLSRSR